MHKLVSPILLAILLLSTGVAAAAPTGTVFTANERDASISQVRLDDGSISTFSLDIAPHNVQVSPDGKRLLAVGVSAHASHHSGSGGGGQLLVFDLPSDGKPAFALPLDGHPAHVITDLGGTQAFVSDSDHNAIAVFDLEQRSRIGTIKTGKYPHGLRLSPDGREIYVANVKDGSVSVINVASLQESARIAVGRAPVQVGFTPDGKHSYVSLSAENKVAIIDTVQRKLSGKIAVGNTPIQLFATPDGKQIYVANQGSSKRPDNRVSVIDPAKRTVVATLRTGAGAHGVAISGDGSYAFVSNIEDGTFSVIDTATNQVIATHKVGAGPNGISYAADAATDKRSGTVVPSN